jgi:hypothetical protein
MSRPRLAVVLPALLLLACGDDGSSSIATDETSGASGGDGDPDGDGDGDDTSQPGDGDGDGDGDPGDGDGDAEPLPPPPSTGIQIVDITVDQGIRVPLVINGNTLSPAQRNTTILDNRPALLRAFYLLEPGFVERKIYAVLTLTLAGETLELASLQTAFAASQCEGQAQFSCRYGSTVGSFNFRIPPAWVQPGVEYRIETFEAAPGYEDQPTAAIPHFPWDDSKASLGVEDVYMKMRVVLVPVRHTIAGNCEPAPDLAEPFGTNYEGQAITVAEFFGQRLAATNPADEVEIIVRDPVDWGGSLTNGSLLSGLAQLRQQDGAPPEQYYYAVATPCGQWPSFSGIAQLGGPTKSASSSRVGWGVWHGNRAVAAETFVHEIGHEQGRLHIACTGTEAGVDQSYPHAGGKVGSFGTDVFRNPVSTHPDTNHDYMSYCQSTWVSEWGWNLVYPWIATISSWELEHSGETKQPLLFGFVGEDEVRWWIGEDYWDGDAAQGWETVEVEVDGETLTVDALHLPTDHSDEYMLVAPLPGGVGAGGQGLSGLHWTDADGQRRAISAVANPNASVLSPTPAP